MTVQQLPRSRAADSQPPAIPEGGSAQRLRDTSRRLLRSKTFTPVVGPIALLLLWWVAAAANLVSPTLFPGPAESLAAVAAGFSDGSLVSDLTATVVRMISAVGLAIVIGVPCGILLGTNRTIYSCFEFLIDFFRSTPVTALFPMFLLFFGIGEAAKISVGAFAAGLLILFNVAYGVMAARPTRKMAAKVMGAGRFRTLTTVTLYEALPQTFIGLRTGSSLALVCIIVAEMFIGADEGIGHRIIDAQQTYQLGDMYGSILVAGVLGYLMNAIFLWIDTKLVHWTGR